MGKKKGNQVPKKARNRNRNRKRKPQTPFPFEAWNKPIGIKRETFSPEAKVTLRLGHKFSVSRPLKESLQSLVEDTHGKYMNQLKDFSTTHHKNFQLWKKRMTSEITNIQEPMGPRIARTIRKGLQDLKAMDIVLKAADKNLGVVAIRRDIYNHLLRKNLEGFTEVPEFPHKLVQARLRRIIYHSKAIPPWQKNRWYKTAEDADLPCPFYVGPKIHKRTLGGRPITAQHSYMLAPVSIELADRLQKEVDRIPEIAQDTRSVVRQLEELNLRGETFALMTFDVTRCYPSIDINDAVKILHDNLFIMQDEGALLSRLLKLVMENNYVEANNKVYKKTTGTATGTQVAPPFANLYLYFKYKEALSHPSIKFQSRYIDDGFILTDNISTGKEIISRLKQASNLEITHDIDQKSAIYLDLEIYKGRRFDKEGRLDLKTYFKPTNQLLYPPANSQHPLAHKVI